GGLATGMDIDSLVDQLMEAERMPLNKMQQDKQMVEWKRDGFRDVNKALLELDNMMTDMKLSKTYKTKQVTSTQSGVNATAGSKATDGSYEIEVKSLAKSAINMSQDKMGISDPNEELGADVAGDYTFYNFDDKGEKQEYTFTIDADDSLNDVLDKITKDDNNVRAFYDKQADKVVFETTRTGNYNTTDEFGGAEIGWDTGSGQGSFFTDVLKLDVANEKGGSDAEFVYNDTLELTSKNNNNVRAFYDKQADKVVIETTRTGNYNTTDEFGGAEIGWDTGSGQGSIFTDVLKLDVANEKGGSDAEFVYNDTLELTSKNNNYEINGLNLNFTDVTDGAAKLVVTNDTDEAFDKIMAFIDKYNEVIDTLNGTQQEERNRDFKPLTEEQKKEMSEKEIEQWEEKAKSGILKGESIISNSMFSMRNSWYSKVDTGGKFNSLTEIGLETSKNYLDGGKIVLSNGSEDKLKAALQEDPESVYKLFSNSEEGSSRGIINRLDDSLKATRKQIDERAGRSGTTTLENYTLGKNLKDINNRISAFEKKLVQVETRYWNQITAMEKAIQQMNSQSEQLMSQFGNMM